MQILIPMSGAGKRFADMGYQKPKPLIEFFGKPMIEHVVENLGVQNDFILCVQQSHYDSDPKFFKRLELKVKSLKLVFVEKITQGAAETCLLAESVIDPEQLLFIANCDQMMVWDQEHFEKWFAEEQLDGAMFTFFKDSPAYSYVEVDDDKLAIRTAEKQVISQYATTGIYIWKQAKNFFWAAKKMIAENIRANNEFYVCPVYNQNIANGDRIGIYPPQEHWPIGTPNDLNIYVETHK